MIDPRREVLVWNGPGKLVFGKSSIHVICGCGGETFVERLPGEPSPEARCPGCGRVVVEARP